VATHVVKLSKRKQVAVGTMSFYFRKPAGFSFKPGQYLDCTLTDPPETDPEGNIRSFSIASAPGENRLMITTRMRDTAFKRVLRKMPLGSHLKVKGPLGSFTLRGSASRPAVFLAGGIGITPFRSMLVDEARKRSARRIVLFYSNRRPEDSAFLHELQRMGAERKNLKIVCAMTEMKKSNRPWHGETGFITKTMLARFVPDLAAPIYYVAGPPRHGSRHEKNSHPRRREKGRNPLRRFRRLLNPPIPSVFLRYLSALSSVFSVVKLFLFLPPLISITKRPPEVHSRSFKSPISNLRFPQFTRSPTPSHPIKAVSPPPSPPPPTDKFPRSPHSSRQCTHPSNPSVDAAPPLTRNCSLAHESRWNPQVSPRACGPFPGPRHSDKKSAVLNGICYAQFSSPQSKSPQASCDLPPAP
jgi:ferredoxin-NADP reductase